VFFQKTIQVWLQSGDKRAIEKLIDTSDKDV